MSHDAPLLVGHTAGSAKDGGNIHELMDRCTNLEAKVQTLEDELKQTKLQYQNDLSKLQGQIQTMQEEINSLKKKWAAHLVLSSPSSAHDDDSAASSDDMGSQTGEENRC